MILALKQLTRLVLIMKANEIVMMCGITFGLGIYVGDTLEELKAIPGSEYTAEEFIGITKKLIETCEADLPRSQICGLEIRGTAREKVTE